MTIRGKSTEIVRDRLKAFGAAVGHTGSKAYVFLTDGAVIPLRTVLTSRQAVQHIVVSLRSGLPALIRLPTDAVHIRVKNNARLVYFAGNDRDRPVTAKVALPSKVRSGCLARELKMRKLLAREGELKALVPALRRYDSEKLTWFEEEYVEAQRGVSPERKRELFLTRHASKLYAPFVRSRPIATSLREWRISMSELHDVYLEAGASMPPQIERGTWPVSLVHGDLSPGNMVAGRGGRFIVVDWEKGTRGPVAWDLRKLYPGAEKLVLDVLSGAGAPGDVEPVEQMRLVAAVQLILHRRGRKDIVEYKVNVGKSHKSALQEFDDQAKALLSRVADDSMRGRMEMLRNPDAAADVSPGPLADSFASLNAYARLPRRLEERYPEIALKDDKFRVVDRLRAIEEVLAGRPLGRMADLGGNVGYFSLSLLDDGMASSSTVYDLNSDALATARAMADALGLQDQIAFAEQKLGLAFLRDMAAVDTILCLNLIHHAGLEFDVEEVRRTRLGAICRAMAGAVSR